MATSRRTAPVTTIPLTIRFQPSLHAWLTAEAARLEVSIAQLVQRIVTDKKELSRPPSAETLAKDLGLPDGTTEKWEARRMLD